MKIAIRTPNWLGDLMMSTAFIRAVLETLPKAQVDLIVKKGFEDLPLPRRGECLVFDKKEISSGRFGRALRDRAYAVFYVLPPSFSAAWMAAQSRAERRIGYRQNFRGFLLTEPRRFLKKHRTQHIIDEYLQLLDPSLTKELYPPRLDVGSEWIESHWPAGLHLSEDTIVLAPGAIYGPAKQWPVLSFKRLGEMLRSRGRPFVVVGTKEEDHLGKIISDDERGNLCGKLTLNEFVAVLARASLLIGNDSGAMHAMGALQRPQIAIFGSTTPVWTGPVSRISRALYLKLDCSPCFKRRCPYTHYNCLAQITPDIALRTVSEILR